MILVKGLVRSTSVSDRLVDICIFEWLQTISYVKPPFVEEG